MRRVVAPRGAGAPEVGGLPTEGLPGDDEVASASDRAARTPLVRLRHAELPEGVALWAKLESVHPGGSIKDRPVGRILAAARRSGALEGRRVLDSSSGNAGIAYAQIGARLGLPITLVVPANASRERLDRIRAHGAELILTDPMDGYDATIRRARELAARHPDRYWYANQYGNPENWRAHYEGTGREILEQVETAGSPVPDAFVSGIGTGGTITGVGRRLRDIGSDVRITAVIPERFPGIEGLKPLGLAGDHVPEILDESLIDDRRTVTSEEAAARCAELARLGWFVGPSSGANLHAALEVAAAGGCETIVTILCDTGERYLSTELWRAEDPGDGTPVP